MIDVSFLFLIFFLISTTFARPEGLLASKLPRQERARAVSLPLSPIVVRVRQAGARPEDYKIRVDHVPQAPANFNELAGILRQLQTQPGFDVDTPVVILPDGGVLWDHVVNAWNAALRAGARNVAFGGS